MGRIDMNKHISYDTIAEQIPFPLLKLCINVWRIKLSGIIRYDSKKETQSLADLEL